jgi:hypothetical protein
VCCLGSNAIATTTSFCWAASRPEHTEIRNVSDLQPDISLKRTRTAVGCIASCRPAAGAMQPPAVRAAELSR